MFGIGKLGRDEGPEREPKPGHGASISNPVAGGSDFEGTPGDVLPQQRGRAADDTPAEQAEDKQQ